MKVEQSEGESVSLLCLLSGHSRQAYYKHRILEEEEPLKEDIIVQQVMGYRQLQPHIGGKKLHILVRPFMETHDLGMGRDAFFEFLRKYDLLNKRRRSKPRTTDSNHWMKKHPNLIKNFVPTQSDQLWVSDITYLTLCESDAFLSPCN
jgi:putative transposase